MSNRVSQLDSEISSIKEKLANPSELGSETEVYARVTGYYRATSGWNAGKVSELAERKSYKAS